MHHKLLVERNQKLSSMKTQAQAQEKEYSFISSVKGRVIITDGTVYADNKKDATYKAKYETSLSGSRPKFKDIKVEFTKIQNIY